MEELGRTDKNDRWKKKNDEEGRLGDGGRRE